MNLTISEFFKRKNRKQVYHVYEQTINYAYDLSERYANKLAILRNRKNDFMRSLHIWTMLDKVEKDVTSNFEFCAFSRCNNLKRTAFIVSLSEYSNIMLDIQKLAKAVGQIESALDFIDYLERNELKVRAK